MTQVKPSTERVEAALAAFGEVDDPLAILAKRISEHSSGGLSDLSVPAHAFLARWSLTLGSRELADFALRVQRISGYASEIQPVIDALKAMSLLDMFKGSSIIGGGGK